jgi:hypothetical protein
MEFSGFLERFADEKVRLDVRNVALQEGFLISVLEKEILICQFCLGNGQLYGGKTSREVWKITNRFSLFFQQHPCRTTQKTSPKK